MLYNYNHLYTEDIMEHISIVYTYSIKYECQRERGDGDAEGSGVRGEVHYWTCFNIFCSDPFMPVHVCKLGSLIVTKL